jgi:uncharacterized protein YndB with AHSA1/START domain
MNAENAIRLEHVYPQPPSQVWRALTDPELHARWWAAGDVRPVVGHRFDLDMGGFGKQPCEVAAVEPERMFAYRFATTSLDTRITWQLTPEGDGTRLTLVHEGFDLESPMGRQAFTGMGAGWPQLLTRLGTTLAG